MRRIVLKKRRDGWTSVTLPQDLLMKRYMEIEVSAGWTSVGHVRQVKRWMPTYSVSAWLNEHAGNDNWQMDFRNRALLVKDYEVAFLLKLRWS